MKTNAFTLWQVSAIAKFWGVAFGESIFSRKGFIEYLFDKNREINKRYEIN